MKLTQLDSIRAQPVAAPQVDLGALYVQTSRRLERIVRRAVQAPEALVEEACQTAWARLVARQAQVSPEAMPAWLATTAIREAIKLVQRQRRSVSLDAAVDAGLEPVARASRSPDEVLEQRERLAAIAILPARQQRYLWMRALGLSYDEIAAREESTPRTVERQLHRARHDRRLAA